MMIEITLNSKTATDRLTTDTKNPVSLPAITRNANIENFPT
jgi:hypothetical protein